MQHKIPVEKLGPQGETMARAVEQCVHCGFCLPACPTYQVLQEEMDSPRGRIFLMKEVLEGSLKPVDAEPYLDRCLGCLGCVSACPSGVAYGELISSYRMHQEATRRRSPLEKAFRFGIQETLPYPARFRAAALFGSLAKPLGSLLPKKLSAPLELLPSALPAARPLPELYPAEGSRRARVALLAGCAQQVLRPEINWATLRVLAKNGVEVVIPKSQGCCGALSMHTGERARALAFARKNLEAFPSDIDAIITNAAGCGSGIHEYLLLFKGEADFDKAAGFAKQSKDVSVFLAELGLLAPKALHSPVQVAYHDACHLAHAQGVRSEPRSILSSIPGLDLVEISEGDLCCGSAGSYNLEQPEIANTLGRRKAANIVASGARLVATGNIGCITQIEAALKKQSPGFRVLHTLEVLDLAYREILG